jgi:hypothetical protein
MILRKITAIFDGFLDRVFSMAGAVIFSQIPRFMDQYKDVLQGALFESSKMVQSITLRANEVHRSLEEFIGKHLGSQDPDFIASGKIMQEALNRYDRYKEAFDALSSANIFKKPFVFFYYIDWELFKAVKFTPGIPMTVEGAVYAVAGLMFGFIFYNIILKSPIHFFTVKSRR